MARQITDTQVASHLQPDSPVGAPAATGLHSTVFVLFPIRIFLAAGWLRAGAEKVIDRRWWSGERLNSFLHAQRAQALPPFRPVMQHVIAPASMSVALVVMVSQLACGVAIATGRHLRLALGWACVMNITFVLAGRVNPSAFYLIMEAAFLFALAHGIGSEPPLRLTKWSYLAAASSAAAGIAVAPFIRTLAPARVIEDPAMMLSFLGVLTAATLLVSHAAHPDHRDTRLGQFWDSRLGPWTSHAFTPRLRASTTETYETYETAESMQAPSTSDATHVVAAASGILA